MNTDRELLELAAKAAGLTPVWNVKIDGSGDVYGGWLPDGRHTWWNPLEDNGDALRLAVSVRADIELVIRVNGGYCAVTANRAPDMRAFATETPGDSAAALRRAIVRAAAEIGRALP